MNGNFRNSYRGGRNDRPFNYNYRIPHDWGFHDAEMYLPYPTTAHYYDMWHPTHQMPAHYPDMRPLPHQMRTHYTNMRPLPHQMPAHYPDNMHLTSRRPHLPTQKPKHYADKRPLPQQMPKDSADKKISPHKKPEDFADKRNLPQQKPEDCTDNKCLPQQTPELYADKRDLPQQNPELYADKRPLADQTPGDFADKRILPHQKLEDCTDNKCLPQQTPDLPQEAPEDYADKDGLPHQTVKPTIPAVAAVKCPKATTVTCDLPHQTVKPTIPAVAPVKCPKATTVTCDLPHQTVKPTIPAVAQVKFPKATTVTCDLPHHTVKPTIPAVAQVKFPKATTVICDLPRQSVKPTIPAVAPVKYPKATTVTCDLPRQTVKPTIPAVAPVTCPKTTYVSCEICNVSFPQKSSAHHNNGKKHQSKLSELCEQSMKRKTAKEDHVIQNYALKRNDQPKSISTDLHALAGSNTSALTKDTCSGPDAIAIAPPQGPMTSQINSQTKVKEGKEHHEVQNGGVKDCSAKKCLPRQMPKPIIPSDKKCLPPQMPKPTIPSDKKCLPPQMPKPTIPSEKKCLFRCEICHCTVSPNYVEHHNNGRKHRRLLAGSNTSALTKDTCSGSDAIAIAPPQGPTTSQINSQTKVKEGKEHHEVQNGGVKDCSAKKCLPCQMPKATFPSDKKCLPPQMPKPTIPSDKKYMLRCEICDVMISPKNVEEHNNGRRHRSCVKSMECKISKGEVTGHIQNSQMNPVVQPKKVPKSMKDGRPVENMSQFRCKEVPAEGSKRKLEDHTVAKDHGFMVKKMKNETPSFKNKKVPAERSKRKVSDNTDAKDHGSRGEIGETSGAKYMKMNSGIRRPVNSSKSESQHVPASLSQEFKGKEHHKFQNTTVEKNDQPQSTPVESNSSEGSNRTESKSCDFAAIALPQVPMNCPVFKPSPVVESSLEPSIQTDSQIKVEGKEHHGVQNCGVETNDQPQSITMELHANRGSDINTLIKEDTCSDSGATVIIPSQSPIASRVAKSVAAVESSFEPESQQVLQTEMPDGKVHNQIQNHTVDSNDQQRSISMELDDPAGCMTNTQTEVVNSDSAAIGIVIEPLAFALPDAVGSGFEPLTEHVLHTEIEPQVSEAIVYYDSQRPIEETDIELPLSVPVEIDDALEVSTETETADGSPQAEVEMDVLADELGIIQLPQVSVCLKCGDEGFEEAIVYCNKCEDCALHRYCLDGPVIFTDEVIWFCEDCEQEVVDTGYPIEDATDSEKGEVESIKDCVTVIDPQPIADPIWRGSLQVCNNSDDKITSLLAHLSTLACPKVLEETRHLPNVLYANLLQRSAVWPASFTKFGTNNLSIGLYFFPQNESAERYYDQLVHEMISNDLALSARVEKSELLIFASTMLPRQYKRFQSKYYLWGIFKRKQAASTIKDS